MEQGRRKGPCEGRYISRQGLQVVPWARQGRLAGSRPKSGGRKSGRRNSLRSHWRTITSTSGTLLVEFDTISFRRP